VGGSRGIHEELILGRSLPALSPDLFILEK
jgi:hypothetical protein